MDNGKTPTVSSSNHNNGNETSFQPTTSISLQHLQPPPHSQNRGYGGHHQHHHHHQHQQLDFLTRGGGLPPSSFVTAPTTTATGSGNRGQQQDSYQIYSNSSLAPPAVHQIGNAAGGNGSLPPSTSSTPSLHSNRSTSPPANFERRVGTRLSGTDKRSICEYAATHAATHEEIAWKFKIDRSTVSKILKDKEKWLKFVSNEENVGNGSGVEQERVKMMGVAGGSSAGLINMKRKIKFRKIRAPKWPELETDLENWGMEIYSKGGRLTEDDIRQKALDIAAKKGGSLANFKASDSWLENFRSRSSIPFGVGSGTGSGNSGMESGTSVSASGTGTSASVSGGGASEVPGSPRSIDGWGRRMEGIEEGGGWCGGELEEGKWLKARGVGRGGLGGRKGSLLTSVSEQMVDEFGVVQGEDGSQNNSGKLRKNLSTPGSSSSSPSPVHNPNLVVPSTPQSIGVRSSGSGNASGGQQFFVNQQPQQSTSSQNSPTTFSQSMFKAGNRNLIGEHRFNPPSPLSNSFVNMRSLGSAGTEAMQVDPQQQQQGRPQLMASPMINQGVHSQSQMTRRSAVTNVSFQNKNGGLQGPPTPHSPANNSNPQNCGQVDFSDFASALAVVKNFLEQTPTFAPAKEMMAIAELYGKTMQMKSTMMEHQQQLLNLGIVQGYEEGVMEGP